MRVHVDPAIAELQKLRPAKLRVYTRDDEQPKAVAIPGNRKRWERLGALLEGLDWHRIEALDARGNIVGVVANDEPEVAAAEAVDTTEAEVVAPLLSLMLKAQQMALQQQAAVLKPLIEGNAKLVGVMTDALGAVAGAYRMALAAASTTAPAGAGESGDDGFGKFLQFAMLMAARQGGGAPQVMAGVKAATDAASARKAPPTPQPSNGAAPGR